MKLHHHRKNASEFPGALSPGKGGVLAFTEIWGEEEKSGHAWKRPEETFLRAARRWGGLSPGWPRAGPEQRERWTLQGDLTPQGLEKPSATPA